MLRRVRFAVVAVAMIAKAANAQSGTIAGLVVDSLHGGTLSGATVLITGTDKSAATDSAGRFRIDNVPLGARSIQLLHPLLDTLGIHVRTPERNLDDGQALSLVIGVPSPATIVKAKCSQEQRTKGAGALIGVVEDADSGMPSTGAEVVVAWMDVAVGKKNFVRTPQRRSTTVNKDGSFLVCGIPDDLVTGVYVTNGKDTSAQVPVNFNRLVAVQSFYMPSGLPAAAETPADTLPKPKGSAVITGSVVDPNGKPMAGARVSIESDNVAAIASTDGRFVLNGARSGTRLLTTRKIGFEPVEMPVNVSSQAPNSVNVRMTTRVQMLEAVKVTALRDIGLQRVGFSERQRLESGKFFSPKDIEMRNPLKLNYLLEVAPMLRSVRTPDGKHIIVARGWRPCLRYYIDGVLTAEYGPADLDMLPDSYMSMAEVAAVEVYDKLSVPGQFIAISRSGMVCSVVVIWTKFKLGIR